MIAAAERLRRRQMVQRGQWDQIWVTMKDGREFFATKSALTAGGRVEFRDAASEVIAIVDLGDVVKAVH